MASNCSPILDSLPDDRINVGNGDQDLGGPVGHGFGDGKLVQITRIIVVYGAPEKVPEIARRRPGSDRRPVNSVELGKRLGRKIRNQSSIQHRLMGDSLQDRAVLPVVGAVHNISVSSCRTRSFRRRR